MTAITISHTTNLNWSQQTLCYTCCTHKKEKRNQTTFTNVRYLPVSRCFSIPYPLLSPYNEFFFIDCKTVPYRCTRIEEKGDAVLVIRKYSSFPLFFFSLTYVSRFVIVDSRSPGNARESFNSIFLEVV